MLLVPLACLGGMALVRLFKGQVRWLNEGLFIAVSLPLWAYLLINLATYSSRPAQFTYLNLLLFDLYLPTFLSIVVATLLLLLILATGLGLVAGIEAALRGLAISTTLALKGGVKSSRIRDPAVQRTPDTQSTSLTAIGTPSSAGNGDSGLFLQARRRSSASLAWARAFLGVRVRKACSDGSRRPMRSRYA